MADPARPLSEITEQAIRLLVREMGEAEAVRFISQFPMGYMRIQKDYGRLEQKITQLFGLNDLRAGSHVLRDHRGWREGEFWLDTLWYAHIQPSFHPSSLIAVAHTKESEFRGQRYPAWWRAAIVMDQEPIEGAILDIDHDPVSDALKNLDLSPGELSQTFDGTVYVLIIEGSEINSTLTLSNPRRNHLKALERALLMLGKRIALNSQNERLKEYVRFWDVSAG